MKSFTTANFGQAYAELSPKMKEQARTAYQLWQENPLHPSLHFKKVGKKVCGLYKLAVVVALWP